ncbi:MAG: carbon-nitrogen hydrolase family protein [Nitrosopumilaceae archaeon]|nr:carbon-nitrogen hydrolase family protein [Nitrosopumilaceae archaeon]
MAKMAVVQFEASMHKDENLRRITEYILEASGNGADVCTFPEFMMAYTPGTQSDAELAAGAETISGPFVSEVCRAASDSHIEVVGTFYEKSPKSDRVYDTAFLADRSGTVRSVYRKIHLYDALGFRESDKLEPGDFIASPVRTGAGMTGMMICYDLRFPEMSRTLAEAGAHTLVAPSAWVAGERKVGHWITMNRARAMENGCFVVAPAHTGNIYCGRSLVVDPFGDILLDMGEGEGIGYADVDVGVVEQTRERLPLLRNRRLDIYPDMSGPVR